MKKLLFLLIVLAPGFFFLSCGSKGEDPQPEIEGYIRFKVDGVQKEFKTGQTDLMSFSFDSNGPVYSAIAQVLGPGSTGTSNFIQINLRNESLFETEVSYEMQDAILYQGVPLVRILFTYSDEEGQIFNAVLLDNNSPFLEVKNDATLRFNKITEDWVEGTFSALLIGPVTNLSVGDQERVISEGQFKMKLINLIP